MGHASDWLDGSRLLVTRSEGSKANVLPDGCILALRKGDAEDDVTRLDLVLGFPELLKQRLRQAGGK